MQHLFARQTAIVALCGHVDRSPKSAEDEVKFEDLVHAVGPVCTECVQTVTDIRSARGSLR